MAVSTTSKVTGAVGERVAVGDSRASVITYLIAGRTTPEGRPLVSTARDGCGIDKWAIGPRYDGPA
jgi:hypothetical protein